jgi:hypothetical protein
MNKRVFFLLIVLFVLVDILVYRLYIKTKKELMQTEDYVFEYKHKAEEIKYLTSKYSPKISSLKRKCKVINNGKYIIKCKIKNKNDFRFVTNTLFNRTNNILSFKIGNGEIYAEVGQ